MDCRGYRLIRQLHAHRVQPLGDQFHQLLHERVPYRRVFFAGRGELIARESHGARTRESARAWK